MSNSSVVLSGAQVPRVAMLDSWSAADWSGGVNVTTLSPFDELTVTTKNSVYTILIVCPNSGKVKVRGGHTFPAFTDARICGSSLGGSLLKRHFVHPGFCLELSHPDLGTVVTTRVRTASVNPGSTRTASDIVM